MKKSLWVLPILLISCGMSDEERLAQRQAQYAQDVAAVQQQCLNFGYKKSDQLFPFCVQTQYDALIEARRLEFQRRMAGWQAISDAGAALQGSSSSTYKCKKDFGIGDTYTCNED